MTDLNQLDVPTAFTALFIEPGRDKPSAPREEIWTRYQFCDDLATLLTDHAGRLRSEHGLSAHEVLERCYRGLLDDGSGVSATEAPWVIGRLAELLEWPFDIADLHSPST